MIAISTYHWCHKVLFIFNLEIEIGIIINIGQNFGYYKDLGLSFLTPLFGYDNEHREIMMWDGD